MSSEAKSLDLRPATQDAAPAGATAPQADSEYDTILTAVMETARGRWFLNEYMRRHRNADTGTLLAAIDRIESLLRSQREEQADVAANAAPTAPPAPAPPAPEPQAPAPAALPPATGELVDLRDRLRDIADSLAECGAPSFLTSDLRRRIQDLSRLCGLQDGLIPQPPAAPVLEAPVPAPAPAPAPRAEPPRVEAVQPVRDPFADIRALSPEEKIALFT